MTSRTKHGIPLNVYFLVKNIKWNGIPDEKTVYFESALSISIILAVQVYKYPSGISKFEHICFKSFPASGLLVLSSIANWHHVLRRQLRQPYKDNHVPKWPTGLESRFKTRETRKMVLLLSLVRDTVGEIWNQYRRSDRSRQDHRYNDRVAFSGCIPGFSNPALMWWHSPVRQTKVNICCSYEQLTTLDVKARGTTYLYTWCKHFILNTRQALNVLIDPILTVLFLSVTDSFRGHERHRSSSIQNSLPIKISQIRLGFEHGSGLRIWLRSDRDGLGQVGSGQVGSGRWMQNLT